MDFVDIVSLNYYKFVKPSKVKVFLKEIENSNYEFSLDSDLREVGFQEIEKANKLNVLIIPFFDERFPQSLKLIKDPPLLLYVKGNFKGFSNDSFAIVGSRKSTAYGRSIAYKTAYELSSLGITIVSGLAYGIDGEAHRGALDGGKNTIAILGNGVDVIYPNENANLYRKIEEYSFLVSEFPLQSKPTKYNFPYRNRIISGLSLGVLVVEAEEKSGSLITATHAIEQGKEVFAVPQNITSKTSVGVNLLIRDGATPFLSVNDVLYGIKAFNKYLKKENSVNDLTEDEKEILSKIEDGDTLDKIKEKLNLNEAIILTKLTFLEVKGFIKKASGRYYKV